MVKEKRTMVTKIPVLVAVFLSFCDLIQLSLATPLLSVNNKILVIPSSIRRPHAFVCQHRSRRKSTFHHYSNSKSDTSKSRIVNDAKHSSIVGIHTIPGTDPDRPQKVNQDASFHTQFSLNVNGHGQEEEDHNYTVLGVMDGHGLKGHVVTKFFSNILPKHIEQQIRDNGIGSNEGEDHLEEMEKKLMELGHATKEDLYLSMDSESMNEFDDEEKVNQYLKRSLTRAFHLAHHDACQDTSIPAGRSGCTCVVALLNEEIQKLYIAHVGDSRTILGSIHFHQSDDAKDRNKKDDTKSSNFSFTTMSLSQETKVGTMPQEKERISQGEGRVDAMGNVFYGPVGIAMTRALGDAVMLRAGVLPTPMVEVYNLSEIVNLPEKDQESVNVLVLGTDGIFDVMQNEDIIKIIAKIFEKHHRQCDDEILSIAANAVAGEARKRWGAGLPMEVKADDITCAVLLLKK